MDKDKKKTLTISSTLKKKIDTSAIKTSGKKTFSVEKKKPLRLNKPFNRVSSAPNIDPNKDLKKKKFYKKVYRTANYKRFYKKR